jgi:hypothetical protein
MTYIVIIQFALELKTAHRQKIGVKPYKNYNPTDKAGQILFGYGFKTERTCRPKNCLKRFLYPKNV